MTARPWWNVAVLAAAVTAAAAVAGWAGLGWLPQAGQAAAGPIDLVTLAPDDPVVASSADGGPERARADAPAGRELDGPFATTHRAGGAAAGTLAGPRWIARRDASGTRVLTERFFRAEQPSPSFDGAWFVFAGRREPSSAAAIWRMSVDGTSPREITRGEGAPAEPILIPGGGVVFTDRVRGAAGARALFACAVDGSARRRLTFGPHRDAAPALLNDGRLRFDRFMTGGGETEQPWIAMTIRPDGTGLARFLGLDAPAAAAPIPSTIAAPPVPPPARPVSSGPATRQDAVSPASLAGATLPVIARAAAAPSSSSAPVLAPSAPAAASVPTASGRREIFVVAASPRPEPPALTSVVSAVRTTGTLLCLDVYASRLPAIADLPRGSVTEVRVTRAGAPEVLATAPVHPDGSFLVEVPADTLVGLTLIGRDGSPLASFRSGVWVRPNENRGCVGCHEPADRVPANRRPMAVDAAIAAHPTAAHPVGE